jgi:cyclic pyranopterin phosphate synthase
MAELLKDGYGRTIRDLRISLTDRCNLRCFYCRPVIEEIQTPKAGLLTFEEITLLCEIFVSLGIEKIRLTGGEPLLRKDFSKLIKELSRLKPALKDLALTTNGLTLRTSVEDLRNAGLDRVTISLDSLRRRTFKQITGADRLDSVLEAIKSAKHSEFKPVKINTVVIRNTNDKEIVDFARFAREQDVSVRFIEFMPLGSDDSWDRDLLVSGKEIKESIEKVFPLELKQGSRGKETAWRYRFADGANGEIGIIAPVTEMFCGACSRIRLTADGQIRTCLFSNTEHNIRDVIRGGASKEGLNRYIKQVVLQKEERHHINDSNFVQPTRTMSRIGG